MSIQSFNYMMLDVETLESLANDTVEHRRIGRMIHILQKKNDKMHQMYALTIRKINTEKFAGFSQNVNDLIIKQSDAINDAIQGKEKEFQADMSNHGAIMAHLYKKWGYNFSVDISHLKNRVNQMKRRQYTDRCVEFIVKYGDVSVIDFSQLNNIPHQVVVHQHAHKVRYDQVCSHGAEPSSKFTIDSSTCDCLTDHVKLVEIEI